jgi:hypothetical protein
MRKKEKQTYLGKHIRNPTDDETQQVLKASKLLQELAKLNDEIPGAIWISAYIAIICHASMLSGISHEELMDDMIGAFSAHKVLWK